MKTKIQFAITLWNQIKLYLTAPQSSQTSINILLPMQQMCEHHEISLHRMVQDCKTARDGRWKPWLTNYFWLIYRRHVSCRNTKSSVPSVHLTSCPASVGFIWVKAYLYSSRWCFWAYSKNSSPRLNRGMGTVHRSFPLWCFRHATNNLTHSNYRWDMQTLPYHLSSSCQN